MKEIKPSYEEAIEAVRTLIRWAGDDPEREGILKTPERVVRSYQYLYSGYDMDPLDDLSVTFQDINEYDETVSLENIRFESHCEHHMMPFIGYVHIAYLPSKFVFGISKLARIVDIYAHRLQIQERLTIQIAQALYSTLKTRGVAVLVEASHQCITCRGIHKIDTRMITSCMLGEFKENKELRREVLDLLKFHRMKV